MRILVADDHILVRQGISSLLRHAGHTVIGEAGDGRDAASLTQDLRPDILLLGSRLALAQWPGCRETGAQSVSAHQGHYPHGSPGSPVSHRSVSSWRKGICVKKTQHMDDLLQAIQEVAQDLVYLCPDLAHALLPGQLGPRLSPDPLSPRERKILQLIAEGKTSLAGLIRYAIRKGFVQA